MVSVLDVNSVIKKLRAGVHISEAEARSYAEPLYNDIQGTVNQRGRSDEELMRNCFTGMVVEVGAAKALSGNLNEEIFNSCKASTHAYDVEVNGFLFEVKSTPKDSKWLNFNIRNSGLNPEGKSADLSTFIKHSDKLDYMVTGYYKKLEEGYWVNFKHLINAHSFTDYVRRSRPMNGHVITTHYYDVKMAVEEGECILL